MQLLATMIPLLQWAAVEPGDTAGDSITTATFCTMVVAVAGDATGPEHAAAAELAALAGQLCKTGAALTITTPAAADGRPHLAVGAGAATAVGIAAKDLTLTALGKDGFVASSNRSAQLRATGSIALSGAANMSSAANSTSGTLYACYHLLRALGVRFLAWDHTLLPTKVPSPLPELDVTFVPRFEYRDVDGWAALSHPQQAKYFHMNGAAQASASSAAKLSAPATLPTHAVDQRGGWGPGPVKPRPWWLANSPYAYPPGFVHTSYAMFQRDSNGTYDCTSRNCPPLNVWEKHRQWFWPHDDSAVAGQLCWTNQSLIDYLTVQARAFLSAQPAAEIISISQNDNTRYCMDPAELKVIQEEGSPMGPLLRAVNQIARSLKSDFPRVAVDTLAYSYSQLPPTITRPEPNVIVRLCNSGLNANMGAPITDPSNHAFASVIEGWNAITKRIYVWDYVVDFGSMVQTFPNYFALGPKSVVLPVSHASGIPPEPLPVNLTLRPCCCSIQYFASHGVRGGE
eukprot:COSAG01_NODE_1018_length_12100_cov_6.251562_1_plen_514_part_00